MDIRFTDEETRRWRASYRHVRIPYLRIPGPPHLLPREIFFIACFGAGLIAVVLMRFVLPLFGLITWPDT